MYMCWNAAAVTDLLCDVIIAQPDPHGLVDASPPEFQKRKHQRAK
jgi:hypothetical protein